MAIPIDPQMIDADDARRARRVPLSSPSFVRMLRSVLPYKRLLAAGVCASIVYAVLHSVSILGAMPVLKVLLEDEGLHGWVDRAVSGMRLGLEFEVRHVRDGDAVRSVLVVRSESDKAKSHGLLAGDRIVSMEGGGAGCREWLTHIATVPDGEVIRFAAGPTNSPDEAAANYEFPAAALAWHIRIAQRLTSFVPRDATGSGRLTALKYALVGVVIAVILANACRFIGEFWINLAVLRAMMELRRRLYRKVLRLPMSRFTRDTGDMVTRFIQDIQEIQRGLMSLFGKSIREPFKAVFILLAALTLDWRITVTMMIVAPFALLIFWKAGASIKKANKKLLRGYGVMIGALANTLGAINIVKAYTTENVERKRLWNVDRGMFKYQIKIARVDAMMSPLLEVIGVTAASAMTLWLGARVIHHEIEVAKFGAIVFMLGMMFDPLRKLADVYARIVRSAAGAERLFELIDAQAEEELNVGAVDLPPLQRSIEFRGVVFAYPGVDRPALDGVNLTVRCGETVALVGRNGSGKTTLVNMLARFYDPQSGTILFDGVDIRTATLKSLRSQIGLVTQDTVIFPMSLSDNIAYGSRNGSRETVVRAATRAFADEFIRNTPDGYETVAGESGKTLSGGQKQRLAIARAILRDAPILIFDEATSQIDSESEQKIQSAIRDLARERTTFIIAHRMSTIRFADRIVVLDAGKIIDIGNHDELMERCALYHGLCETQLMA